MEYDYGRSGQGYDSGRPVYGRTSSSSSPPASNFAHYPRIGAAGAPSPMGRTPPPPHLGTSPSFSSGATIRVAIKPMYQVAPPPQLRMQSREVPRSLFQFDFDVERRILAEAEAQGNPHLRASSKSQSQANGDANLAEVVEDATVAKYLAMGHSKEAVQYALQTFGDDQTKILDFCPAFYKIRDMGFQPDRVARALAQHNNDEEQAVLALVGV